MIASPLIAKPMANAKCMTVWPQYNVFLGERYFSVPWHFVLLAFHCNLTIRNLKIMFVLLILWPMPYKVFSYKVVIWIVTHCVFRNIERDNPKNAAAWMRYLDGSNFEKILRKTCIRGTCRRRSCMTRIENARMTGDNNSVKTFFSISSQRNKCFVFLFAIFSNLGANTVDRGHVRRASWDPYTIGHLWRGGSCEGPNAVRFFALRYGGLQGGLVKIKLQSFNRWICGW